MATNSKAPENFIVSVLTQLDSVLYEPGEVIVGYKNQVHDLFFIAQGVASLNGYFDNSEGETKKMCIVRLREGSWYGEFQILLGVESNFELEASFPHDRHSWYPKREDYQNFIQIFKLSKNVIKNLHKEFPEFSRFLILRALQRRCFFMKVFQHSQNYLEFKRKRV